MFDLVAAAFGTSQNRPAAHAGAGPPNATAESAASTAAAAQLDAAIRAGLRDPDPPPQEDPDTRKYDAAVDVLLADVGGLPLVAIRLDPPAGGGGVNLLEADEPPDAANHRHSTVQAPPGSAGYPPTEDRQTPADEATRTNADNAPQRQLAIPPAVADAAPSIKPETARYAYYPDDIELVLRFTQVLSTVSPDAQRKVRHEGMYKLVLQGVRLMHLCQYEYEDVVLTLAYASVYWKYAFQFIGHKMSATEAAHVCVLLIYLAHSFLLDETCQLRWWSKQVFKKYCTIKGLDAALFRLLKMRKYKLMISNEEQVEVLRCLRRPNAPRPPRLNSGRRETGEAGSGQVLNNHAAPPDDGSHSTRKNGEHDDCGESSNSTTAALTKDGSVDAD